MLPLQALPSLATLNRDPQMFRADPSLCSGGASASLALPWSAPPQSPPPPESRALGAFGNRLLSLSGAPTGGHLQQGAASHPHPPGGSLVFNLRGGEEEKDHIPGFPAHPQPAVS